MDQGKKAEKLDEVYGGHGEDDVGEGGAESASLASDNRLRASSIVITAWLSPPLATSPMITTSALVSGGSCSRACCSAFEAAFTAAVALPFDFWSAE